MIARTAWTRRLRSRFLVQLRSGTAIEGILWRTEGRVVILRDVRIHAPGSTSPVRADGEVLVELDHIDYAQLAAPPSRST